MKQGSGERISNIHQKTHRDTSFQIPSNTAGPPPISEEHFRKLGHEGDVMRGEYQRARKTLIDAQRKRAVLIQAREELKRHESLLLDLSAQQNVEMEVLAKNLSGGSDEYLALGRLSAEAHRTKQLLESSRKHLRDIDLDSSELEKKEDAYAATIRGILADAEAMAEGADRRTVPDRRQRAA